MQIRVIWTLKKMVIIIKIKIKKKKIKKKKFKIQEIISLNSSKLEIK